MKARHVIFFAVAITCFLSRSSAVAAEPELHVRSGLPTLSAWAKNNESTGELRVAYLGGSITAAGNGWRTLTTEFLQTLFPKRKVIEIAAGLPGTGSNLGACRLDYDVLRHRPDLLFVEFAVNDTGVPPDRIERTIEGIVRHTWRANPRTDICFIYTVSTPHLASLEAGDFPPSTRAMEAVAAHYQVPSLHLGVEVVHRVAAGSLVFKGPAAPDAATTFSLDGVHPTAAGHRIYFETISRALPALLKSTASVPHALPAPLHSDNWENASLLLLDAVARTGDWIQVAPDDPNLRGATKSLLPPTWRAVTPGSALTFEFHGRSFGLLGIAAPDSGEFRVTVDDLPPITATFFDAYVSPTFCRQREWFFPSELADGTHHVRIELLSTTVAKAEIKAKAGKPLDDLAPYAANTLTLCGALIVGSPLP